MILAVVVMFMLTSLALITFIVINPKALPVLKGQKWQMPGIGIVTVVKVLGPGSSFEGGPGSGLNVMYQIEDGTCGICRKSDLRNFGKLFPYPQKISSTRQSEIDEILKHAERYKEKLKQYSPPSSHDDIQDAEIVVEPKSSRAIRQYKRVMSYSRKLYPRD